MRKFNTFFHMKPSYTVDIHDIQKERDNLYQIYQKNNQMPGFDFCIRSHVAGVRGLGAVDCGLTHTRSGALSHGWK